MIELDYVIELTTDSVQSAIDRSDLITDLFSAEVNKDDLYSGMRGLKSIPIHILEKGFKGMFAKAEEFLFLISETRLRIINLLAWLYREAKKYDSKRDEAQDVPETKPEEILLKNFPIDKGLILKFLKTEDSFMARYLSSYLKPASLPLADLRLMEFDYFNRPSERSRKVELEDVQIRESVRSQGVNYSSSLIDAFSRQLTGKATGDELVSSPMRQEQGSEAGSSLRALHKQLADGLAKVKTAMSKSIQDNAKLVKTVV